MVEGAHVGTTRNDAANYGIQVTQHISRGNAHYAEPFHLQKIVSQLVLTRLCFEAMRLTIYFDDELPLQAGEIGCDPANWKLPPKL